MKRLAPSYDMQNTRGSESDVLDSSSRQAKLACSTDSVRHRSLASSPSKTSNSLKNEDENEKTSSSANSTSSGEILSAEQCFEMFGNIFKEWEEYGHRIFDQKSEAFLKFAQEIQDEVVQGSMSRAESMVKYLEATSIGHEIKDLELVEKVTRAVDYVEKALEESRLSMAIQTALANACDRLLTFDELPEPWQENPYIVKGYRFSSTPGDCVRSILSWHNETANIWTHLLASFLFIGLGIFHLPNTVSWQQGTWVDRIPMILFIIAALKCLICSVIWHSFSSISHLHTKRCMACVDYTGITVCICASILTTEYSVLKCHPFAQAFYMFITLVCGIVGVMLNWHPRFDSTGARPMRALFFSCFAVFGGLCGVHACFYRGVGETFEYYIPILKSIASYATGVIFYATLFPERYFGGIFDFCGTSHNIWHAFVVGGIFYHYKAMIEIFERAIGEKCVL